MADSPNVSDERLAALIQYGAPGGLAPHDFMSIVRELQERRAHEIPPASRTSNERLSDETLQQWIENFSVQTGHPLRRLLLELQERRGAGREIERLSKERDRLRAALERVKARLLTAGVYAQPECSEAVAEIDRALSGEPSSDETAADRQGGAIREAQLYRALERLHYAVRTLAEAHAFDLTGPVKSDHESSLWLDLNEAQANAAQKIKYFAEKAGDDHG